jgi:hypothetical protein
MIRLGSAQNGFINFLEVQKPSEEETQALQKGIDFEFPYVDAFHNCLVQGFWYDLQEGVFYPIAGQTPSSLIRSNTALSVAPKIIEEKSSKVTPLRRFLRLYFGLLVISFLLAWINQGIFEIPLLMLVWFSGAIFLIGSIFSVLWVLLHFSSGMIQWVKTGTFKSALGF